MKTLEQIKDEVAIDNDYRNWRVLPPTARERLLPEVCKRYARAALEKAAESAGYTQYMGKAGYPVGEVIKSSITDIELP